MRRSVLGLVVLAACSGEARPAGDGARADQVRPDLRPDAALDLRRDLHRDLHADAFVPFSLTLTVNAIPAPMNGSVSFTNLQGQLEPFRLTLPRAGFTVDVSWRGSAARPETLQVSADVALGTASAGSDLAARFQRQGETASWLVPIETSAPVGALTLSARMSDGSVVRESKLTVDVVEKTFLLDPFRLEDPWLLVFSQDLYTINRTITASGDLAISSAAQSNGLPDFDEDLRAIGFGTSKMLPSAAATKSLGVTGTNAIMRTWVQRELLKTLNQAYARGSDGSETADSVHIRFYLEGESGAPALTDYTLQVLKGGELTRGFSAIAIGGGDVSRSYLGMSKTIDLRNLRTEDNLGPTYGVFTTKAIATLVQALATDPAIKALFQAMFGDFVPELGTGGHPVGEDPLDAEILAASFDPLTASAAAKLRLQKLTFLVETLGRLAGALTAHEIAHSLGLVANGPPPYGLFGGEKNASFVDAARTTSGHIDTEGFNIEEAGPGSAPGAPLNPLQYLGTPRFNELDLAYLRGRLLLLPKP
jgi:hypothetical protein